jgi:hypothetical protein
MRLRLSLVGTTISLLLLCQSYSVADNVLSGSGNFVPNIWVNLNGGSANIANFGPDSLNGNLSFSNTYTNYQETPGIGETINYTATLTGGSIYLVLSGAGASYSLLNGSILSGSLKGYYCIPTFSPWCGPWGGSQSTTFEFSGVWDNGWQAQGSVFIWSYAWHSPGLGNYAIVSQPPGSETEAPEPNSLVLLGPSALGLLALMRRRLTS